jgi:anti-sigma factor RsiW
VDSIDASSGNWGSSGSDGGECRRTREVLHAYADGALDLVRAMDVERHLRQCGACGRARECLQAVRSAVAESPLYHRAPRGLERRVRAAARAAAMAGRPALGLGPVPRWVAAVAALVLVALLVWSAVRGVIGPHGGPAETALARTVDEVVAGHVRSLMADHLVDVESSDRHTVKPWFNGKLDFTPDVRDFAAEGFPLAGGRLDYVAGRPAAALVYRRGGHYINLFVWRTSDNTEPVPPTDEKWVTANGYHAVHWTRAGLSHWAVTDADEATLRRFAQLARSEPPATSPSPQDHP